MYIAILQVTTKAHTNNQAKAIDKFKKKIKPKKAERKNKGKKRKQINNQLEYLNQNISNYIKHKWPKYANEKIN